MFSDFRLDEIYRYWQGKRGGRAFPARADIQPGEMGPLVRLLNLIDVSGDPPRFRHRLVGSEHVEWLGRDATGLHLDAALYGDAASEIIETLTMIVREKRPYRRRARLDWNGQAWLEMESVEMPLGEDGAVRMILRAAVFRPAGPAAGRLIFTPLT